MIYAISAIIIAAAVFCFYRIFTSARLPEHQTVRNAELVQTLLSLDDDSLVQLFKLYKEQFGANAARYANQTYRKWKAGKVRPNRQTFNRLLVHLPKVMNFDLKCELLRRLMEEYCPKDKYSATVYSDEWENVLTPMVKNIIDKAYTVQLPKEIEEKLQWISEGEMQTAQNILKKSQYEQSVIAVSMLREEFRQIENLVAGAPGKSRVKHQLKFPYGTIDVEIKFRR